MLSVYLHWTQQTHDVSEEDRREATAGMRGCMYGPAAWILGEVKPGGRLCFMEATFASALPLRGLAIPPAMLNRHGRRLCFVDAVS